MARATCIDDKNRPPEIPLSKWVKEGEQYNIIRVCRGERYGGQFVCQLMEIDLDESCAPYEFFMLKRFAIPIEDLQLLIDIIENGEDITELLTEINHLEPIEL